MSVVRLRLSKGNDRRCVDDDQLNGDGKSAEQAEPVEDAFLEAHTCEKQDLSLQQPEEGPVGSAKAEGYRGEEQYRGDAREHDERGTEAQPRDEREHHLSSAEDEQTPECPLGVRGLVLQQRHQSDGVENRSEGGNHLLPAIAGNMKHINESKKKPIE